ncbi:alpha/beta hydrolase [Phycicoccus endophyticus]|uniref:Alpha/beta hydrolase n=1 Tax=Phycicoccus endophyticus TaxID=1690220 RepID=A0A7G9R3C3_9MICO|nr:alpha/beta hydrolase [Phycicoccus endophyticus]NHI19846.1 alpha/beta hydrolase [Phycicoccus endophyticus]QNN50098.1 alpha/beta hydrolase [Phycicoccus endophyticus]GGL28082.1 alpha/beta hydrolase [Phycicoccus endophyticus]
MGSRAATITLAALAAATMITAAGAEVVRRRIVGYLDPWKARVADAGFVLKAARVGEIELSYAEGPDNGPPLVLLHAQHMDWFSYSRVLPALSEHFHVFDIDYPGHGATVVPSDYPMTANRIGADLATFIQQEIREPVFATGNSSGGLLTAWLAAHRPDLVRAIALEDPPLFSAEYPRITTTIANRSFATCADAVRDGITREDDFLLYWIRSNTNFFTTNIAPGSATALAWAIKAYRHAHPGQPVELGLPPDDTVRLFLRGMDRFDPRFGAAFHDGTWNQDFDHATALTRITCPAILLHAEFTILPDGTLDGAMSQADADKATSLLQRGEYRKINTTHVIHLADPGLFTRLLEDFLLDQSL